MGRVWGVIKEDFKERFGAGRRRIFLLFKFCILYNLFKMNSKRILKGKKVIKGKDVG